MDVNRRPSEPDEWPTGGERTQGEAHLEGVLDALGEGVLVQDAEGRIRSATQRTLSFLGLSGAEARGQHSHDLRATLYEPSGEVLTAERRPGFRALLTGQPVVDQLVRCSRPGLPDAWLELSSYPLRRAGVAEPYGVATSIRDVTARREVEERNRFQARLLDSVGQAVISTDHAQRISYWNEAAVRIFGWTAAEALGRPIGEVVIDDSQDQLLQSSWAALDHTSGWAGEVIGKRKDGTQFPLDLTLAAVPGAAGEPAGVICVATDITDRKQAERRTRHLSAIVESSGDAILSVDLEGAIMSWNRGAERLYGYTPAEAIGKSRGVLIPLAKEPELATILERVHIGKRVERFDTVRVRKDGSHVEVAVSMSPLFDDAGRVVGLSSIARDISELKALERTMLADRASLAEAQRIGHLGSFERDLVTGTRRWSDELYRMLDIPTGTPIGDDLYLSFVHPDDRERTEIVFRAAVESGVDGEVEHRIVRRDGSVGWVHVRHLVSDDGTRIHGTVLDVTDRVRAEEAERSRREALEASRLKTAFVSRMSHELRTPLNAILGFGQLLELDELSADQRDSVDNILRAGEHLLGLISEILDISTIERGAFRVSLEAVAVGEVVDEVAAMLRPLAERRRVRIIVDQSGLGVCVLADRQRFKQVVLNLLANAVKYNRDAGEVRISGELIDGGFHRLTFNDTGIGIAQEEMDRLFQPFERLWAGQAHVEGAGLGLAVSRQLANAMAGEIGVVSRIGDGSSFWVELPVTDAPAIGHATDHQTRHPSTSITQAPKVILYVEDNPLNVRLIERVMARRPDVTLTVAMEGRIALELAGEQQPDLILLDLHLPDISGEEVLRRLRADPRTASTAVIVLSADAASARPAQLRALGASDYMTKPLDISLLLDVIDDLEPAPRATDAAGRTGSMPTQPAAPAAAPPVTAPMTISDFVHDLHNLLGVILNYCTLLRRELSDPATAADLDEIRVATERAVALAREMSLSNRGA